MINEKLTPPESMWGLVFVWADRARRQSDPETSLFTAENSVQQKKMILKESLNNNR